MTEVQNAKIAVIGTQPATQIYRLLGFDVIRVDDAPTAKRQLQKLAKDHYGVIYLTEPLAEQLTGTLAQYDDQQLPIIVPIPDQTGTRGVGKNRIQANVEKALGRNIL